MTLLKRLEKYLFYAILFAIPLNLGKHYVFEFTYVYGKLIDYLIPTIYVQDILIFFLLLLALPQLVKSVKKSISKRSMVFVFLVLFIVSVSFSVIDAFSFWPSLYAFLRLALYVGFGFYVFSQRKFDEVFEGLSLIIAVLILGLSLLGIAQWLNQGSVFNNYLFFGEQPYSFSTPNIVKESLFGFTRVPPYGTFRHPNIFAGFLSFGLLVLIRRVLNGKGSWLIWVSFFGGLITLILTFSWMVFFSFLLSVFCLILLLRGRYYFNSQVWQWFKNKLPFVYLFFVFLVNVLFFLLSVRFSSPSISYRRNLLLMGVNLVKDNPLFLLFGVGFNNFTYFVDIQAALLGFPKFTQPIHNVYVLLLVESGIFALVFFAGFLIKLILRLVVFLDQKEFPNKRRNASLLFILLLHLLLMGAFDHFLFTSHQIQLIFWLTVGFSLQYNLT